MLDRNADRKPHKARFWDDIVSKNGQGRGGIKEGSDQRAEEGNDEPANSDGEFFGVLGGTARMIFSLNQRTDRLLKIKVTPLQSTWLTRLVIRVLGAVCLLGLGQSVAVGVATPGATPLGNDAQVLGHFVIADFDGDQKPDFATVNVDQSHIEVAEYSIHLQLSHGLGSSIGLMAPAGGLQLFSRDVNGDDILDVVVRTALDSNLVAVLINDGDGKFTVAQPEMFPELQSEPGTRFVSETRRLVERILLLPSRGFVGDYCGSEITQRVKTVAEALRPKKIQDFSNFFCHSKLGRSPPELL
jgi:hypothetical protein